MYIVVKENWFSQVHKSILKRSHKLLYYDAHLKPYFLYDSSVWSSTSKANLDSIFRFQKGQQE